MRPLRTALLGLLAACSSTPSATILLVTGEEADALTRTPAPTTLVVHAFDTAGRSRELSRGPLTPGADVPLGEVSTSEVAGLRVEGLAAGGAVLVRGETLFFQFGALEASDLSVFVQRTGELARLPNGPTAALDAPLLDAVLGRYVLAASGASTQLYDLLLLRTLRGPVLPRPARSMTSYGSVLLVLDEQGATTLDLTDGYTMDLAAPAGGTWAEVAGGATVLAPDGAAYVVGGTRVSSGASARVLRIAKDGKVTFASLASPREGACAAWVEGRGLVVVGGDATAAGAELLAADAALAAPLPFPPDTSRGCGAAAIDPGHVVVAGGGVDAARVLDLACAVGCTPTPWQGSVPLARAQGIALAADAALFVGDDASGDTHAYRASPSGVREIPVRAPRKNARLLALPNGASAVVGGAPSIESYRD